MASNPFNTSDLEEIPLFKLLSLADLHNLANTMKSVRFDTGDIICQEGERGDSFYTIVSGQAAIIKSLGTPEEQQLFIAKKGDFIGEMALFEPDGVRVATVMAYAPVIALQMTRTDFNELLHTQPQLAFEVSRVLSLRVSDANKRLQDKNEMLEQALIQLKAAQAELIDKERMERELELARTIQEDILPKEFPQPARFSLGARMTPAREVGGDFFDFIRLSDHKIGILIGDVSDKGVPAAIYMALTRSLIHAEARRSASPEIVLRRVNMLLHEMSNAAMFVTALYGILDCQSGHFEYTRAGHELPIVFHKGGREYIPAHDSGQPLALFEEINLDTQTLDLLPGTMLTLYTDGATDSTAPDQSFFGLDRLKTTLLAQPQSSAQDICDGIMDSIMNHQQDSRQYDDITLITIFAHESDHAAGDPGC